MPNRRDFILTTAAAGAALTLTGRQAAAQQETPAASKALRVLILGATGFIGPHFVRAAVERGHRVSVFIWKHDKNPPNLPAGVAQLVGDRDGDLSSIENREWDAVFDLATYVPIWVRTLGQALAGRVRHYTVISTEAVYQFPGATDENSKVTEYTGATDPYALQKGPYGPMKVLCEREAERQFPGKALVLRPGSIVGPNDSLGLFTYWPVRMEQGGEILAAGDPLAPVQLIDVRDLAEWAIRMAERGETGTYNAIGPALPMSWGEMLGAIRGAFSAPIKLTWIPTPWLIENKVKAGSGALFWATEGGAPGLMRTTNDKARAKGLAIRPSGQTAVDTLAWYKTQPPKRQSEVIRGFEGKGASIEACMAREKELLATWRTSRITDK